MIGMPIWQSPRLPFEEPVLATERSSAPQTKLTQLILGNAVALSLQDSVACS
jgi:hypothetical protein